MPEKGVCRMYFAQFSIAEFKSITSNLYISVYNLIIICDQPFLLKQKRGLGAFYNNNFKNKTIKIVR